VRRELTALAGALSEQLSALGELLTLSYGKRGAVISGVPDRLNETVKLELRGIAKLKSGERARVAAMSGVAALFGIESGATLREVIAAAQPDERPELERLYSALAAAQGELSAINDENGRLIKSQLEYTEAMLNVMLASDESGYGATYGGDGQISDGDPGSGSLFRFDA
jgi:flagellar biosynthesis/type III secretory pathway chaperone